MWEPISLEELLVEIQKSKVEFDDKFQSFWDLTKISPEKWKHSSYGIEEDRFWIVALFGKNVIWYDDIEEGFNVGNYKEFGIISEGGGEQDELKWCINKIFNNSKGI